MDKDKIKKIKTIITDMVIEFSNCTDCAHFDNNQPEICNNCELKEKFKLSEIDKEYITEKVELIKNALK